MIVLYNSLTELCGLVQQTRNVFKHLAAEEERGEWKKVPGDTGLDWLLVFLNYSV